MIRVYYDGKCGICRTEMAHYRRNASDAAFEWLDITQGARPALPDGLSRIEALKALHVQDDCGQLHRGVDAFMVIWRHLPRFRWLNRLMNLPGVLCVARRAYHLFAGLRFRWMGYDRCARAGQANED